FWHYLAVKAMSRHMPPLPAGAPPLLTAVGEKPPLPQLSDAVAALGFADLLADSGGTIRGLPLWVRDGERVLPQLGLALACVYYDCPVRDVQITEDRVVIPRTGGPPVVIPTTTRQTDQGVVVGSYFVIPFM